MPMRRLRDGKAAMAQNMAVSLLLPVAKTNVVTQPQITVLAYIFVQPGQGTVRKAQAGEANLSIWDAPSSKWQPGMSLAEGGWNQVSGPVPTDSDGRAQSSVPVHDGWVRILATHAASGAQVATAFESKGNYYVEDSLQVSQLIRQGSEMPATFQQPGGLEPYSSTPSIEATGLKDWVERGI